MTNSFKGFKRGEMAVVAGFPKSGNGVKVHNASLFGCSLREHQVMAFFKGIINDRHHTGKSSILMSMVLKARKEGNYKLADALLGSPLCKLSMIDSEYDFIADMRRTRMKQLQTTFEETGSLDSLKKPLVKAIREGTNHVDS